MNALSLTQGLSARILAAVALFSLVAGLVPMQAFANHDPFGGTPQTAVEICHQLGNGGYRTLLPNISASGGNISVAGHEGHDAGDAGPKSLEDIIPPFHFDDNGTIISYPGKNWNASTEDKWANGNCNGDGIVDSTTGTVKIQKNVTNDNGGVATASSFTFKIDGNVVALNTPISLAPGAHTVIEDSFAGYTAGSWAGDCAADGSITVVAGQNFICSITNNDNAPVDMCPLVPGDQADTTLCPAVDMCPLVPGDQADTTLCPGNPGPDTCTVTIVSDTSATVVEKGLLAQALSFVHPAWTAAISGATWIWGDNPVVDPTVNETQTFENKFGFMGTVTNATLEVASDNDHYATLNSNLSHNSSSSFNAVQTYNVTSEINQGNNQLDIAVTNTAVADSNAAANPAGVLYKLVITGTPTTDADCAVPYENDDNGGGDDDDDDLACTITVDDSVIRRGRDVNVTWDSTNAVSAMLNGESVALDGTQLFENLREDTTYTLTITGENDQTDTCSVTVDTRSGGGGGGNSAGDRDNNDDQDGEVLGDSDDADEPAGEVAGDQVSVVPTGAPNAGNGGTSPFTQALFGIVPVAFVRRTRSHG